LKPQISQITQINEKSEKSVLKSNSQIFYSEEIVHICLCNQWNLRLLFKLIC